MEFEIVNILVDLKQVKVIKSVVETVTQNNPRVSVTPFKFGKIGDDILVSFKVDKNHHALLIEKLTQSGIQTVNIDLKSKKLFEIGETNAKTDGQNPFGNKPKRKQDEKKTLEQLIEEGDYNEVIRISKSVTLPKEEIYFAQISIDDTIQRAISNAFSEAELKRANIDYNLGRLITIASDQNLKVMQKLDFIKRAGLFAIQICIHNSEYVGDLIDICNNNTLHSIINIKAAVSFYDVVIQNRDTYEEEVALGIRRINTRWLLIAINSVEAELTDNEKGSFYKLIDFITSNRS